MATDRQLEVLAHEGVAPIGRHQQPGLVALAAGEGQGHPLFLRRYGGKLGRTAQPDVRGGVHRLLQLYAGGREFDHLAEGGQTKLRRREPGLAAVAPIRDMDMGDGGAVRGKTGPEPVTGQRLAGAGGERDGAGIEAGMAMKFGGARLQQQDLQGGTARPFQGGEGEGQHGAAHTTADDSHVDVNRIRMRHEKRA